ncbi:hypothetical protein FRC01_014035, partial [Tulasnella sp. 417]
MSPVLFPILLSLSLARFVKAQRYGTLIQEIHPPLSWQNCIIGLCTARAGKVVIDANWRRYGARTNGDTSYCYDGIWHPEFYPNEEQMNDTCALEGIPSYSDLGVSTNGNALHLQFVTEGPPSRNVGSRVYLMADDNTYAIFKPLAQEITFDVDMSNLPCGIAADIHFAEMAADGGIAESGGWNTAGAKYGTGYCGAQCPRDVRFINGRINPNPPPIPPGLGGSGFCCAEMDLWQANSLSTVMKAHPCKFQDPGLRRYKCYEDECGASAPSGTKYNGVCDPDGCDFNPYRMGKTSFYGPGKTVDTTKKLTVVTQFVTSNGTPAGSLVEIRRKYVQNGVTISNSLVNVPNVAAFNSITSSYCNQQKAAFVDETSFQAKDGLGGLTEAFKRGMVLVLSIYADPDAHMLWLDGPYPPWVNPNSPGVTRGICADTTGVPADLEAIIPTP